MALSAPHRIFVATPCSGETVTTEYLHTVLKLQGYAYRPGATFSVKFVTLSIADIYKARNALAAAFMADPSMTHLLFLDADMGFEPRLVEKMLQFDQPFTAALSPQRSLDAKRFHDAARRVDDPELAERLAAQFVSAQSIVGESVDGGPPIYRVDRGFVRIKTIGSGIVLLRREVFITLREAYPELMSPPNQSPYRQLGTTGPVHQCFASLQLEDGNFLSEDISFCYRWDRCGGKIWACVDEDISHVGQRVHRSAYIEHMRHGLFQT